MKWLDDKLSEKGIKISDVFLMTVNENGDIRIIKKEK